MKRSELEKIIESVLNKVLTEVDKGPIDPNRIYISTKPVAGDLGKISPGEMYIKYKSEDGPNYVHLNIANPGYDYSEDIETSVFKSSFRQLDTEKDLAQMKQLNKWHILEFGTSYYIVSFDFNYKRSPNKAIDVLTNDIKTSKKTTADSPKLAMKKAGYEGVGTIKEVVKNKVWIAKLYANWVIVSMTEDPKNMDVKKLLALIKKSGLIELGL